MAECLLYSPSVVCFRCVSRVWHGHHLPRLIALGTFLSPMIPVLLRTKSMQQWIDRSTSQGHDGSTIKQSINQSIDQSINQSTHSEPSPSPSPSPTPRRECPAHVPMIPMKMIGHDQTRVDQNHMHPVHPAPPLFSVTIHRPLSHPISLLAHIELMCSASEGQAPCCSSG